jgi:hypothetical protein
MCTRHAKAFQSSDCVQNGLSRTDLHPLLLTCNRTRLRSPGLCLT